MVLVHPFRALRPTPSLAPEVAAAPYDVISAGEAAETIRGNPRSFLRVSRADAELPGVQPHADTVYHRARENLVAMERDGILQRDGDPYLYLYQVTSGLREVTGLVCTIGVDELTDGTIRSHELTRRDKEEDRTRHIEAVKAQTGLVFLFYLDDGRIGPGIGSLVPRDDLELRSGDDERVRRAQPLLRHVA